jgi:hypothetical protein
MILAGEWRDWRGRAFWLSARLGGAALQEEPAVVAAPGGAEEGSDAVHALLQGEPPTVGGEFLQRLGPTGRGAERLGQHLVVRACVGFATGGWRWGNADAASEEW